MRDHPLFCLANSRLGMKDLWETSSSQANAKPGQTAGCSA